MTEPKNIELENSKIFTTKGLTDGQVTNYYRLMGLGLEDYTVKDLQNILESGVYKDLSTEVTEAIFNAIAKVYIELERREYDLKNYPSKEQTKKEVYVRSYSYGSIKTLMNLRFRLEDYNFHRLTQDRYLDFFTHHLNSYFTNIKEELNERRVTDWESVIKDWSLVPSVLANVVNVQYIDIIVNYTSEELVGEMLKNYMTSITREFLKDKYRKKIKEYRGKEYTDCKYHKFVTDSVGRKRLAITEEAKLYGYNIDLNK